MCIRFPNKPGDNVFFKPEEPQSCVFFLSGTACSSEFTNAFMTQAEFYIVFDTRTAKNQDMQHTHLKNKLSASGATASYRQ